MALTDAQKDYIRQHYWALGASRIAHELGLTKSQVAGVAYRDGLRHRLTPGQASAARQRAISPAAASERARRAWITRRAQARSREAQELRPLTPRALRAAAQARREYYRSYAMRLAHARALAEWP